MEQSKQSFNQRFPQYAQKNPAFKIGYRQHIDGYPRKVSSYAETDQNSIMHKYWDGWDQAELDMSVLKTKRTPKCVHDAISQPEEVTTMLDRSKLIELARDILTNELQTQYIEANGDKLFEDIQIVICDNAREEFAIPVADFIVEAVRNQNYAAKMEMVEQYHTDMFDDFINEITDV